MKTRSCSYILIFLFFLTSGLVSQNINPAVKKKIDSLETKLSTAKEDTNKVNILFQLFENYGDNRSGLHYADQTAALAEKLSASTNPDISRAAKRILASTQHNMGFVYEKQGDVDKAIEITNSALKLREEIGDKNGIASSYNNLGFIYSNKGDIHKALEFHKMSLKIREEIGDKKGIALSYNNIGLIFKNQGNIERALEWYHKSLKIREEIGDKNGIAISYNNFGVISTNQGDASKALEWFNRSLTIGQQAGDKQGVANTYNNIGSIYMKLGTGALQDGSKTTDQTNKENLAKALSYFNKSLMQFEEIENKRGIAFSLNNIGLIYKNQAEQNDTSKNRSMHSASDSLFDKALESFNKSLTIRKAIGDKSGMASSQNSIGGIYLWKAASLNHSATSQERILNYKQAENYCNNALLLGKEIGFPETVRNSSEMLSKIYKALGNENSNPLNQRNAYLTKAVEMHELFKQMADSINNVTTRLAGIKKQLKYEFEKKEDAINAEQDRKDIRASEELHRQKVVRNSFIGGFILVLILAVVVYRNYRQKQKANIEITKQKHIIEEKQKEILDSINYAQRIQQALLASDSLLSSNLPEYFKLFKPKDIVSGDFYWASALKNGNFAIVTADSTGHGVPGAFMSLLNISFLNESINERGLSDPADILNHTRSRLIQSLSEDGSVEGGKDGMDCILCCFDLKNMKLKYAAANNSFYIFRNNILIDCDADKMPVGKSPRENQPFITKEIDLQKGDIVYTLTDGYPDQFGGPKGKKFKYQKLNELLLSIAPLPLAIQKEKLEKEFGEWKGELDQVDDVLLIGVKI